MIIVIPCGGLANRMRVVHSAMAWQAQNNGKIRIGWIENAELNCSYDMLFENVCRVKHFSIMWLNLLKIKKYLNPILLKFGVRVWNTEEFTELMQYVKQGKRNKCDIIFSYTEFYPSEYFHKEYFLPTSSVKIELEKVIAGFTADTIGVHIRRTDNSWSIEHSPIEAFVERMEAEIQNHSTMRFYLATDDYSTKQLMKDKFGDRIITSRSKAVRNTQVGIIEAWIELLALSHTQKILGSYYSSFSEMAARIGGIELNVVWNE